MIEEDSDDQSKTQPFYQQKKKKKNAKYNLSIQAKSEFSKDDNAYKSTILLDVTRMNLRSWERVKTVNQKNNLGMDEEDTRNDKIYITYISLKV